MHKRSPITEAHYWRLYKENEEKLVLFSTISDDGGFFNPDTGQMMTEWGFSGDDCPYIGIHEKWDIEWGEDSLYRSKRNNVRVTHWLCIPINEVD